MVFLLRRQIELWRELRSAHAQLTRWDELFCAKYLLRTAFSELCNALHYHRRAIRKHFSDALHHLSRVVTRTYHSIRAEFARV